MSGFSNYAANQILECYFRTQRRHFGSGCAVYVAAHRQPRRGRHGQRDDVHRPPACASTT